MNMKLSIDTAFKGVGKPKGDKQLKAQREDLSIGNENENLQLLTEARNRVREHMRALAKKRFELKQAQQNKRWEVKARELHVLPGSSVHIKTCRGSKGIRKKLRSDWEGLFKVLQLQERDNLLVQKQHTPGAEPRSLACNQCEAGLGKPTTEGQRCPYSSQWHSIGGHLLLPDRLFKWGINTLSACVGIAM